MSTAPVPRSAPSRGRPERTHVLALVTDRTARSRLRATVAALGLGAAVRFVDRRAEVADVLASDDFDLLIVEPRDAEGLSTPPLVSQVRAAHPSLPVIAYCALAPGMSRDLVLLARSGADEILLRGFDDLGLAFRRAASRARQAISEEAVVRAWRARVPEHAWPIVDLCIRRASERLSVVELARMLGVHRRTLVNRLAAAGLPGPAAVQSWALLSIAASLLADRARPAAQVARCLGFPSLSAFRKMLRRYAGLTPRDLRAPGGVDRILDRLAAPSPGLFPGGSMQLPTRGAAAARGGA